MIIEHLITNDFEGINIDVDETGVYFGVLILRPKAPPIVKINDVSFQLTSELINKNTTQVVIETGFDIEA